MHRATLFVLLLAGSASSAFAQHYLSIEDPQGRHSNRQGTIEEATVSLRPQGAYVEVGLYMTLGVRDHNAPAGTQLEAEFDFELPEGSLVTDSWLWVGEDIMQAQILDVWTARETYEGIVNRRRDPSILYYKGRDRYELRVYPVFPTEKRKVKINYLVPADLAGGSAVVPLPIELLQGASRHDLERLEILAWGESWGDPVFSGVSSPPDFELREPADLDPHFVSTLELSGVSSAGVGIPVPFKDGIHFSTYEAAGDKYFQLLLDPEHFIPGGDARHVLVLLDHESSNTSMTPQGALEAVRAAMKANLRSTDYFNLMVSQLDVVKYSTSWTAATDAAIDAAVNTVGPPASYSSLPGLLNAALTYARESAEAESILLVSSSDGFDSVSRAEGLLQDLSVGTMTSFIQVVDYQDGSKSSFQVQGRRFYGNQYLYERLAGADDVQTLSAASTLQSSLGTSLGLTGTRLSTIDLYTDAAAGFTFDRHLSVDPLDLTPVSATIAQIGRFVGEAPFEVNFSGFVGSAPFSIETTVAAQDLQPGSVNIGRAWAGYRLAQLEDRQQTNDVINETLTLSLQHRVLSQYSAFLALEPSDTTAACLVCLDDTNLTSIESADDLPRADSLMQVYPNPVRESATILVALPEGVTSTQALRVFDILGREVKQFTLQPGSRSASFSWDRTSANGDRLAAGVYMLSMQVGNQVRTTRVVLL